MKNIKHIRQDFLSVPWVMHAPGSGTKLGQKFNFLIMVMWHIKLKGMGSRPGYTDNCYPKIELVTLGLVSNDQVPLDIFESVVICDGAPSMCSSSIVVY